MSPDPSNATPARLPTLRQLEARVARLTKTRVAASEKLRRAHATFNDAFTAFEYAMGEETLARGSLSLARQGRPAGETPAPPAPETLTAADEED